MTTKPKTVKKAKEKKPIESEVKAKPEGKVAQIEALIVDILSKGSITKKEMLDKRPSEFNAATWQTRIYRLQAAGVISYDKKTKMLRVEAKESKLEKMKVEKAKKSKPSKAKDIPCFI